jgi:putative ATP-binding cassette transporter
MDRVSQFETAMGVVDNPGPQGAAISIVREGAGMTINDLTVKAAGGEPIATLANLVLAPGERALVRGASGAGKSSLCRALTGIWPLGEGNIRLPQDARVLALPQRPYFPLGTLRQALTYPTPVAEVDDTELRLALAGAGLGHLADRLDEEAEWSTILSGGEQQRIGFARALMHRPDVLLLDEAVSTLEDDEAQELYATLAERLPAAIVISIGRSPALVALHHRIVDMSGGSAASRTPRVALAPLPA